MSMRKYIIVLLVLMSVIPCMGQQEFYRDKGGMSLMYSSAHLQDGGTSGSYGASMSFKGGFTAAIASAEIGDETKPQVMAGFISKPTTSKPAYARSSVMVSYLSVGSANIVGVNTGLAYLINAQRQFPTSINGGLAINYIFKNTDGGSFDNEASGSNLVPIANIAVTQALFNRSTLTPFLSTGLGYDLTNSQSFWMVGLGVNVNFNGKLE